MQLPVSNNFKSLINRLLLLLLLLATLLKSELFVNAFYTQLFVFVFAGCIIITAAGFYLFCNGRIIVSLLPLAMLVLLPAWAAYIYLTDCLISSAGNSGTLQSFYLLTSLITCFAIVVLLKTAAQNTMYLFSGVLLVAIIQAAICLLQLTGIATSGNEFFKVAGSWLNPNIAAMYIALAFPIALYHVLCNAAYSKWYALLMLLMAIALLLLKSRTAILGTASVSLILLQWRYHLLHSFLSKLSGGRKVLTLAILIMTTVLAGYFTYNLKKESADSRVFIWKTAVNMIAQKPLTGYGYGTFERNYNLFQAAHFKSNTGTEIEIQNAAHTKMAYNEFLQSAVEGGLPGAAFLLIFVWLLLRSAWLYLKRNNALYYKKEHGLKNSGAGTKHLIISATGIAGLLFMSLMNFTLLTIPVTSVFIVYAASIIYTTSLSGKEVPINKIATKAAGAALLITGVLLGIKTAKTAYNQHTIKKAVTLALTRQYAPALTLLQSIPANYRANADYYQTLGNSNYFNGNKAAALTAYTQAAAYTSAPELYQQTGNCYAAQQQYNAAIANYGQAMYIQPNRVTPRYLLLGMYIKLKDSSNTLRLAKEILAIDEKVPSPQINRYKKTATDIIKKLQQKNSL
jgi:O-antigen polymerase